MLWIIVILTFSGLSKGQEFDGKFVYNKTCCSHVSLCYDKIEIGNGENGLEINKFEKKEKEEIKIKLYSCTEEEKAGEESGPYLICKPEKGNNLELSINILNAEPEKLVYSGAFENSLQCVGSLKEYVEPEPEPETDKEKDPAQGNQGGQEEPNQQRNAEPNPNQNQNLPEQQQEVPEEDKKEPGQNPIDDESGKQQVVDNDEKLKKKKTTKRKHLIRKHVLLQKKNYHVN